MSLSFPNTLAPKAVETQDGLAWRPSDRPVEKLVLATIILISVALSAFWAIRVPIFEEPDESAHFDYAITIATSHHLILARDGILGSDVHPYTRYLEDITNFRGTRYNRDGRVPAGYGTAAFFRHVDSGVPALDRGTGRVPYIVRYYPFGFYAIEALVINAAAVLSHGSLVAMFFSARLFCVLLLPIALLLSYAIMLQLEIPRWTRFAILFAIGLLPMTSWVFGYMQPDDLAFVLSSLAIYLALRARSSIRLDKTWLILGLVLGALSATKAQYFLAVAVPGVAWLLVCARDVHVGASSLLRKLLLLGTPILILTLACAYVNYAPQKLGPLSDASLGSHFFAARQGGLGAFLSYIGRQIGVFYSTNFGLGRGLVSYWGAISWLQAPVEFGNPKTTLWTYLLISVASTLTVVLMLTRQARVIIRISVVARHNGATALRLLTANVLLNSYFVFAALLLCFSIWTNGEVIKQGRYWLPFITAALLCAAVYAPEVLPLKYRLAFSKLVLVALCCFSLSASAFAIRALDLRFYVPPHSPIALERALHIDTSCQDPGTDLPSNTVVSVRRGSALTLCGWALDLSLGEPVTGVMYQIDSRRPVQAGFGSPRRDVVQALLDERFLNSGFRISIPSGDLETGSHDLKFLVVEKRKGLRYAVMRLKLDVLGSRDAGFVSSAVRRRRA